MRHAELQNALTIVGSAVSSDAWVTLVAPVTAQLRQGTDDPSLLRAFSQSAAEHLVRGHVETASRWTVIGLHLARKRWHVLLDALRPSLHTGRVVRVVRLFKLLTDLTHSQPEIAHYREAAASWHSFAQFFSYISADQGDFIRSVRHQAPQIVPFLLSLAEAAFGQGYRQPHPSPGTYEQLDREEIASGVSKIISTLARFGDLRIDARARQQPSMESAKRAILHAFWHQEVFDAELRVFRLGYKFSALAQRTFRLEAPTTELGVSLSHGYYLSQVLPALNSFDTGNELISIDDFCRQWVTHLGHKTLFARIEDGRPRLRFQIPEPVATAIGQELLHRDIYFREEAAQLETACNELNLALDELLDLELDPELDLREALKIQRILAVIGMLRHIAAQDADFSQQDRALVLPMEISQKDFADLIFGFGISHSSATAFIRLFTWPTEGKSFLDIQYTPLLGVGNTLLVQALLASRSNLIRNALWHAQVRPRANGTRDPLSEGLKEAFTASDHRGWTHVRYDFEDAHGEIDFIGHVDDKLLIVECKDTLHPCSSYELRRTWDHLEKASDQLDRFRSAFEIADFRANLSTRLGVDIRQCKLLCCIALSHRLLSGIHLFGYPVFPCAELTNFVRTGEAKLRMFRSELTVPLRPSGRVTGEDLQALFDGRGKTQKVIRAAGFEIEGSWKFGRVEIRPVSYAISLIHQLASIDDLEEEEREQAVRIAREFDQLSGSDGSFLERLEALQEETNTLVDKIFRNPSRRTLTKSREE